MHVHAHGLQDELRAIVKCKPGAMDGPTTVVAKMIETPDLSFRGIGRELAKTAGLSVAWFKALDSAIGPDRVYRHTGFHFKQDHRRGDARMAERRVARDGKPLGLL